MREDLNIVKQSNNVLITADKTSNLHKLSKEEHGKLLKNAVTSTYKKASENIKKIINKKARQVMVKRDINPLNRMDINSESNCFFTEKDYQ